MIWSNYVGLSTQFDSYRLKQTADSIPKLPTDRHFSFMSDSCLYIGPFFLNAAKTVGTYVYRKVNQNQHSNLETVVLVFLFNWNSDTCLYLIVLHANKRGYHQKERTSRWNNSTVMHVQLIILIYRLSISFNWSNTVIQF